MKCKQCNTEISTLLNLEAKNCGLCVECFYKPFNITSVCRADLIEYANPSDIGEFDDAEMSELREKMAEAYMNVFWIDLSILADFIIEDKYRISK